MLKYETSHRVLINYPNVNFDSKDFCFMCLGELLRRVIVEAWIKKWSERI